MDGILIINKPQGSTSHDIVYKVKKMLSEKVGHTGTLDPNATGVLPLLIGKGTLCSKYLINHDKIYEVKLKLGIKTDKADIEGKAIEEKEVPKNSLDEENVKNILKTFLGKQEQKPPMYSAIKVKGKKLYEYARKGQVVEIEPRKIEIYEINLNSINVAKKEINFTVHCSKGTYIRSLCEDIAEKLETVGFMKNLNRTKVGNFSINQSTTLEQFEKDLPTGHFGLITIEEFFSDKNDIKLNANKMKHFINGVKITFKLPDGIYKIYDEFGTFIGIGIVEKGLLKRDIVI